jgi:hypothetical protein
MVERAKVVESSFAGAAGREMVKSVVNVGMVERLASDLLTHPQVKCPVRAPPRALFRRGVGPETRGWGVGPA